MGACPLEDRSSQGGVCPGIRYDHRLHGGQITVLIACRRDVHPHGMAFRVHHDALLPGELHLYDPLCQIGEQRRMVLHGHVFLPAESAAHQFVFHDHLLRRQPEHDTALMLSIICTLVRRIDKHAVIKRHRHRAFRFQERMLSPGSFIVCGHFIF